MPAFEPLNIWNLKPGTAVRVFAEGTVLHFEKRDYLPYHSGHTVYFREATIYLCDLDDTSNVVENRGNEYYERYTEKESGS